MFLSPGQCPPACPLGGHLGGALFFCLSVRLPSALREEDFLFLIDDLLSSEDEEEDGEGDGVGVRNGVDGVDGGVGSPAMTNRVLAMLARRQPMRRRQTRCSRA